MFNILNLDPFEFEKFCLDFMEKKLNIKFKRFGPGKDDGIDLISLDGKIICQCKRYKDSSKLVSICKKEFEKIKNQSFKEYYLLTSAEVSETVTKQIYEIFIEYMKDYSFVIGKNDIDDFLSDENNIDVLKRNHKLWLSSSLVLDLYLNRYSDAISKVVINEFEKETKYFVETKAYYNAIDIINSNGIILLVGDPGIGKTLTSKMLIRYLLINNKEFRLTTVSNNNLSKLIESMQQNDNPEIIFLDDFLGQTSLSINDTLINELKSLLKLAKIFNNKKVILNSRITILNKAKNEKEEFEKILDEIGIKECLIDVNDMTKLDRARILYNLMYHNGVAKSSYETVINNKNYNTIINHKSFNTRIIEMCAIREKIVKPKNFFDYVIATLNNPKDVWKSEFDRIEKYDVVLMYQLYTLGNNYIPIDVLKKATINFLLTNEYDVDRYSFDESINRLSKSLIGIAILGKKKYVSVLNPSINDYIQNYLLDNDAELKKIFNSALYIEQVDKILSLNSSYIEEHILDFDKLVAYNYYNSFMSDEYLDIKKKIEFIIKFKYCDKSIEKYIRSFFEYDLKSNYIIKLALNKPIREFYSLEDIINNVKSFSKMVSKADYDYIEKLLEYYSGNNISNILIEKYFTDILVSALEYKLVTIGEEIANEIINDISPDEKFIEKNGEMEINNECIYSIDQQLQDELTLRGNELINDIEKLGYNLEELKVDYDSVIDNVCVEMLLDDDLKEFINELKSESIDYDYLEFVQTSSVDVDDIFKQNYNI